MKRLKITLPFDRFFRFQSSAEDKWREIRARRSRLPVWLMVRSIPSGCSHKTVTSLPCNQSAQPDFSGKW